jgi:hypothetical protein
MPNVKKKGYSARDLRDVSDSPELTREDFAKARPFAEALPELAASKRPRPEQGKRLTDSRSTPQFRVSALPRVTGHRS